MHSNRLSLFCLLLAFAIIKRYQTQKRLFRLCLNGSLYFAYFLGAVECFTDSCLKLFGGQKLVSGCNLSVVSAFECLNFLIKQDVNIRESDLLGQQPVHLAAAHNRIKCLRGLITKARCEWDCEDRRGRTTAHLVSWRPREAICRYYPQFVFSRRSPEICADKIRTYV